MLDLFLFLSARSIRKCILTTKYSSEFQLALVFPQRWCERLIIEHIASARSKNCLSPSLSPSPHPLPPGLLSRTHTLVGHKTLYCAPANWHEIFATPCWTQTPPSLPTTVIGGTYWLACLISSITTSAARVLFALRVSAHRRFPQDTAVAPKRRWWGRKDEWGKDVMGKNMTTKYTGLN